MKDESPRATARRFLLRGVEPAWVLGKLRSYEQLDPPGQDLFPVRIRGPGEGGFLQVDIDPGVPLYHFHNLGMWMVGLPDEDPLPSVVILQSKGPVAVDYWLVPRDNGSVLHGRRADGSPYGYDLAGGITLPVAEVHPPAGSTRLALLNRGLPLALADDWQALPVAVEDKLRPWVLEKEGTVLGRFFRGLFGA